MTMKKVFSLSFIFCALFLLASCDRNLATYEIPAGNPLVSFVSDAAVFEMAPEDGGKITVELNRVVTTDALTVPVTITDATGGLLVPAKNQFDFAAGESKATLDFTYTDLSDFDFGTKYKVTIALAPADDADIVSPSGYDEVEVVATRKMTKVSKGIGTYYSDFFEEDWDQELQSTVEAPNYYIWPNCWVAGTDFTFTVEAGQPVLADIIATGYSDPTYGPVYMYVAQATATYSAPAPAYDATDNYIVYYAVYRVSAGAFGLSYEYYELPEGVTL